MITPENITLDTSYIDAGHWSGWTVDAAQSFYGTSPSCDELDESVAPFVDRWSTSAFSFGYGVSSESALADLQQAVEDAGPDAGDWDEDWVPYIFHQYMTIDGIDGMQAWTYARAWQLDDTDDTILENSDGENELVDMSDATFLKDGYYSATIVWSGQYLSNVAR